MSYELYVFPTRIKLKGSSANREAALKALKNIVANNPETFHHFWDLSLLESAIDLVGAMEAFRWRLSSDMELSYDGAAQYPEGALIAIAPFIVGSVELFAEDSEGNKWMWLIQSGELYTRIGHTEYSEPRRVYLNGKPC